MIEIFIDEIVVRDATLGEADVPAFRAAVEQRLTHLASGSVPPAPHGLGEQVADATWQQVKP